MALIQAKEWKRTIYQLKEADPGLRVFGANLHKYRLRLPLPAEEIQAFEQLCQIKLPEDYKEFLREVGDGGAGPKYGLAKLINTVDDQDLASPFLLTQASELYTQEEQNDFRSGNEFSYPGLLQICDAGCAIYYYLVVNGPAYGTIWSGHEDFYPTGLSFAEWYQRWINDLIERALPMLEQEKIVDSIEHGMTSSEVIEICGKEPKRIKIFDDRYFLRFPHLATEFEFNQDTDKLEWLVRHAIYCQ